LSKPLFSEDIIAYEIARYSNFFNIRIAYPYRRVLLLFGHKNKPQIELQVDLDDLQNEKENLTSFLQLHLKVSVSQVEDKLRVDSEQVSVQELQHMVTKFVYHRDLNGTHWVSVEGLTVKINRFNVIEKKEKPEEEPPHQTAAQSWGL
jgi:hypothetical protein